MQLACEKCATQYTLDDSVIPPEGAPVQCTRCGHVFIAAAPKKLGVQQPSPGSTQVFGMAERSSTQVFGAVQTGSTQMFASSPFLESPLAAPADSKPGSTQVFGIPATPVGSTTHVFAGASQIPVTSFPSAGEKSVRQDVKTLGSILPPMPYGPAFSTSAVTPALGSRKVLRDHDLQTFSSDPAVDGEDDAFADQLRNRIRRRRRVAWWIFLAMLGSVGYFGYRRWASTYGQLSSIAISERERAWALLRKDDSASRAQAISALRDLVRDNPSQIVLKGDYIVSLLLELDDDRLSSVLVENKIRKIQKEAVELGEKKVPSDWENRVNVLTEEVRGLQEQQAPTGTAIHSLENEVKMNYESIRQAVSASGAAQGVVFRTEMMVAGVSGILPPESAINGYQKAGNEPGWSSIALSEYAVNGRASEAVIDRAKSEIRALRASDSSFFRAYVLAARIALKQGQNLEAITSLDALVALNPSHQLARSLLSDLQPKEGSSL